MAMHGEKISLCLVKLNCFFRWYVCLKIIIRQYLLYCEMIYYWYRLISAKLFLSVYRVRVGKAEKRRLSGWPILPALSFEFSAVAAVLNNRQLSFVGQGGSWPGHKKLENVALMRRLFEHNFQTDRRRQLFGQPVSEVLG